MSRLNDLLEVTEKIASLLETKYETNDERIVIIDRLNELLEERGKLIESIVPPYTEEEKEIGKRVIAHDKKIQESMENLYETIREDLKHLKQKKDSNKTYINPYGKMGTVDGMYLDNKL